MSSTWFEHCCTQVPGYPTWYNIIYDGDSDLYSYELLKDYAAGDLIILV